MHDSWQSNVLNTALVLPSKLLEIDLQRDFLQTELVGSALISLHAVIQIDLEDFFFPTAR